MLFKNSGCGTAIQAKRINRLFEDHSFSMASANNETTTQGASIYSTTKTSKQQQNINNKLLKAFSDEFIRVILRQKTAKTNNNKV